MLCNNCTKLLFQFTNKKCMRCTGSITQNIHVICDSCSKIAQQCAACLKKIQNNTINKHYFGGCGSCKR